MRIIPVILTAALLAACGEEAPKPPAAEGPATAVPVSHGLGMEGLAPARIGMTLDELQAAVGPLRVPDKVDPASCFYVSRAERPGLLFMMLEGNLQRVDVREGDTATDTGLRIGDDVAKVSATYSTVDIQPHKYEWESGAQYLTVFNAEKSRALRFVTSGGKIASFQAGMADPVQWVEGCG